MKKLLKVLFISFVLLCAAAGLQYWSSPARLVDIITTLGGGNNGILYAYQVMNLDLEGTKMVVLSACETGLGDIMNGEGVYGLSRSFQVAGAGKIIMSLWKVDDNATQELMTSFYTNWLQSGDPLSAFIISQKLLKEKYPNPKFWGAFVLLN